MTKYRTIPINELKSVYSYEPITGILSRIDTGQAVGSIVKQGYLILSYKDKTYKVHRICFALYHGYWPTNDVDHKNRIKTDNRIINLRNANKFINNQNIRRSKLPESGFFGVYKYMNRFETKIQVNNTTVKLGVFDTAKEASIVYEEAKRKLHAFI